MSSSSQSKHLYITKQLIEQLGVINFVCANKMFVLIVHLQCGGKMDYCPTFVKELFNKQLVSCTSSIKINKNKQKIHADKSDNDEPLACNFTSKLMHDLKMGIGISFPVPLHIQSIIDATIETLSKQQLYVLQLASAICKAKGNIALQFEQPIIEKCVDNSIISESSVVKILSELCEMKLIYCLQNNNQTMLCKHCCVNTNQCIITHLLPGYIRQHEIKNNSIVPVEIQSVIFHYCDEYVIQFADKKSDTFIETHIFQPMPTIQSLLQEPILSTIPYRRGHMYKRSMSFLSIHETKRLFVFKHDTLYWFKENKSNKYPTNKLHMSELVKLKREDNRCISLKTERNGKLFGMVLRCNKKKDMEKWVKILTESKAITANVYKPLRSKNNVNLLAESDGSESDIDSSNDEGFLCPNDAVKHEQCLQFDGMNVLYEFGDGFLRDIVYKNMTKDERMKLHRNVQLYFETSCNDKISLLHARHSGLVHIDMFDTEFETFQMKNKKRSSFFDKTNTVD